MQVSPSPRGRFIVEPNTLANVGERVGEWGYGRDAHFLGPITRVSSS